MKYINKINRCLLLLCILLPSLRGGARAAAGGEGEGLPLSLSLSQCLQLAAEGNLALRAADLQTERARLMQGTAWDVGRTELSLAQDPTSGGSPDNALAVQQSIEFPTVYAARRSQLKAETRVEESRRAVVAAALRADIASAYWQLVYHRECVRILAAGDSALVRYASVAESRYKAGEARQIEQLGARQMMRQNELALVSARADMAAAQHRLASLVGSEAAIMPADSVLRPVDFSPSDYVYAATAEGELAYNRLLAADKAVRVARSEFAPSLSLALKNQLVISGWDPYHENRSRYKGGNFMGFEVGIGIPLFYGAAKARLKAARKDREIAETEMRRLQNERQNEYKAALVRYNTALSAWMYYETEGLPDADRLARLGAVEYEGGEISYVEYAAALQQASDTRMKRAAALNEYNQAAVQLQRFK